MSGVSACPSQKVLQYFLSVTAQLQLGWAHFFGSAILMSSPELFDRATAKAFQLFPTCRSSGVKANRTVDFVIVGYAIGGQHFDALIFGYAEGDRLMYAGRTQSGFAPALRKR